MVVAGGGTGGHLFPGLAVAEQMMQSAGNEVVFVGSSTGIEARVIPGTRFAFHAVDVRGLRGRGVRGALQLAYQLPVAVLRALRLLGRLRTQVVLGVGGYASFPVVCAAWLRGIPAVLLEQNAIPGMANRVLARLARRVCTNFPDDRGFFPAGRVVQTGNPVRKLEARDGAAAGAFTLLVFGGSQGARRINDALFDAAPRLFAEIPRLRVIHQTGAADLERLRARYRELGVDARVLPFIDDMGAAYGEARLVVCRAGATTLAELTNLGKPAVLIPYRFAADDHQRANAEVLAKRGAAVLILEADLSARLLADVVIGLARDEERLKAMGAAARGLAVPDAAARVLEVCRQVAGEA